jgi:hypothetical protein
LNIFAIKFLTRKPCHLCDAARPLVRSEARRLGIDVVEVDVDDDDRLLALYGLRIPVVLGPGDQVLAEGVIEDRRALRRVLRRARGG